MNQAFDYNGVVVAQSAPKKVLKTIKKTIHIDSADRDTTKYFTNGDFWVYLPRNYSNIVSIRLKDAQFPPLLTAPNKVSNITGATAFSAAGYNYINFTTANNGTTGMSVGSIVVISNVSTQVNGTYVIESIQGTANFFVKTNFALNSNLTQLGGYAAIVTPGALIHTYSTTGMTGNSSTTNFSTDTTIQIPPYYFLIAIEGLNKVDETSVSANRSSYIDSFFAKIPNTAQTYDGATFINYNDHSALENIATYSPPIENLDRLRITVRTHSQQDKGAFIYWTTDGGLPTNINTGGTAEFNLTLEVEYLENGFTDFSSFETRLSERS